MPLGRNCALPSALANCSSSDQAVTSDEADTVGALVLTLHKNRTIATPKTTLEQLPNPIPTPLNAIICCNSLTHQPTQSLPNSITTTITKFLASLPHAWAPLGRRADSREAAGNYKHQFRIRARTGGGNRE